jgi:hypothetical protein
MNFNLKPVFFIQEVFQVHCDGVLIKNLVYLKHSHTYTSNVEY